MKATVVVDNIKQGDIQGEWGLSIFIQDDNGKNIMLDVGGSDLFAENAKKLGIDISTADYAVLSHAHYDHSNGMACFFKENTKAKFFLRETTEANCYGKKWIFSKYIGIPRRIMIDYSDRIEIAKGDVALYEGVTLVPHKTPGLEAIGKRESMYRKTANGWVPDNFSHEQSLVMDTEKGMVIFNCCSHGGAANIINEVSATFPEKKVHAIIGGFHLFNKSEREVREFAKKVKETGIEKVVTGHCTGQKAYDILKEELGEILQQLHVGLVLDF